MENIVKKIQYITVDSNFITSIPGTAVSGGTPYTLGGTNNFSVNFGSSYTGTSTNQTYTGSNVFIQEFRNVIGIKLVDFYVTQVGSNNDVSPAQIPVKYIDILCPDLPDAAQILDERKSRIFARIPLERDFSGSSNIIVDDKQWKSFNRQTNYFNPLSLNKLYFQIWEMVQDNDTTTETYQPLNYYSKFYMILEVTSIDTSVQTLPKEDKSVKIVDAIEALGEKLDLMLEQLPVNIPAPIINIPEVSLPKVPELDNKKQMYVLYAIIAILVLYFLFKK